MSGQSVDILFEVSPGETRAAIVDADGNLLELLVERIDRPEQEGGIHLGRVTKVEPSLGGAFIALGAGEDGFLRRSKGLHEGQSIIVQVTRETSGMKGPTVTDKPSMVGRYLALTPSRSDTTYSGRLGSGRRRAEIEALEDRLNEAAGAGVAVRASAAYASDDEILAEAARLAKEWAAIEAAASENRVPSVLAPPPGLIARILRDREGGEVVIDDPRVSRDIETMVRDRMPDRRGTIRRHDGRRPLFEAQGIAEAVEGVCDRIVTLPRGARLIIDPVEALTAIDVDSGAGGKRAADDAILRTNLAVLPEVARQIRLRNLSGLIVIDFISMRRKAIRAQFMQSARRAFRHDPMQVDVMGMTAAGLLELTRRRGGAPLHDLLVRRAAASPVAATASCAALRAILRLTGPGRPVIVAAPTIIAALEGPLAAARAEVDRRMGQPIELRADALRRDWEAILERNSG